MVHSDIPYSLHQLLITGFVALEDVTPEQVPPPSSYSECVRDACLEFGLTPIHLSPFPFQTPTTAVIDAHTYTHTHTHAHKHTHTNMHTHTRTRSHTNAHTHPPPHTHTHTLDSRTHTTTCVGTYSCFSAHPLVFILETPQF